MSHSGLLPGPIVPLRELRVYRASDRHTVNTEPNVERNAHKLRRPLRAHSVTSRSIVRFYIDTAVSVGFEFQGARRGDLFRNCLWRRFHKGLRGS